MPSSTRPESAAPLPFTRREFLQATAGAAAAAPGVRRARFPVGANPELEEATIADLQRAMADGSATSRSLCQGYLERIADLDVRLRSVIELNPDALAIAGRLDAERSGPGGRVRGPLHGIPIVIKDNIGTMDRMETTAGSLALVGVRPFRDATVAERLRAAGAVLLGKANLSEWANFRSTRSTSGWSGRGGLCRNPYALDRSACGSSSGTGAAVSASLAAVGVGTETDGSIVCPAAAASLVGVKPTVGLVSRAGIIPIAHSQDTAGPMCRTVTDAAILLGALAGTDPLDPATRAAAGNVHPDYTRFLDPRGLQGARIGVARERFFGYHPGADRLIEEAIAVLTAEGAVVVDPANVPNARTYRDTECTVLLYEFKAGLNAYLADVAAPEPVRTLAGLIRYNEENRSREMPFFGQEIFEMAQEKGGLTDPAYREALEKNHRLSRAEGLDAVLDGERLDALIAPTGAPPWTIDLVNGDHFLGSSSQPAAVSGYPNVTVPAGYVLGLPVGISFFGRAWSEPTLLRLAFAYEQATRLRRPPRYLTTADLEP